ncbi:conserved hypothetical protein [Desulfamplus magnetovallimortis]|uniref:Uncharacterized protein n=1 Tax=Desulfamplus magnetovallimortis TaxID=1246637 RepID=L0R5E6_9BACT|nr:hypothetical protein [Desulfamplus magnetovallimortis]CCO06737.1 conserved hypothetical protein [Desulfamplus magnetovallimortis BW-1]SLM32788.1 conserved hypothetical protein [Desulfamplus magnetovallimortis]
METVTLKITNDAVFEKILWLLNHIKEDGVEIVIGSEAKDLELLKATRDDESIPFDEYLKNED